MPKRLTDDEARLVMLQANLFPKDPYPGSCFPWLCTCMVCGKEVNPTRANVASGHSGCKYCTNRVSDVDVILSKMNNAELRPLVPYPGAQKPWLCECKICLNEVRPWYNSVRQGRPGCKYCSTHGFDFNKPAYLYLVTNLALTATKIGITTATNQKRIKQYVRNGWKLELLLLFDTGKNAYIEEQNIVVEWRRADFPIYLQLTDMPNGGHTETAHISASSLALKSLVKRNNIAKTFDQGVLSKSFAQSTTGISLGSG